MNECVLNDELLNRYLDGLAGESDLAVFQQDLIDRPELADALVAIVRLEVLLQAQFKRIDKTRELEALLPHNTLDAIIAEDLTEEAKGFWIPSATCIPPSSSPTLGFLPATLHNASSGLSSDWTVAYLIATVIFGLGAVIGAFTYVSQPAMVSERAPVVAKDFVSNGSEIVGTITGVSHCQWSDPSTTPAGSTVVPLGRKYVLTSGLMEITYHTGAKVILQGPVTYEVESKNGGFLSVGKLTGKIATTLAKGFVVRTPTATVTDLGTEFGVEVSESGETISHVFRGSVVVRVAAADASSDRELVLHENEAVSIRRNIGVQDSYAVSRTTVKPSQFARSLPESGSQPHPTDNAYAEYVLSLKPAVYYRMEPSEPSADPWMLFDSAPGGHHGKLYCDKAFLRPPYLDGRYDKAILFRGPIVKDHAIVPDYPKVADDQLSVSAWVIATTRPVRWAMIASNWGDDQFTGQFHLSLHRYDGDLSANVTQRNGEYIEVREGKSQPLPLGVWQHVAFTADGATLRLYRNGVEVASTPCSSILPHPPMAALGVGCKTNDAGTDVAMETDCPAYWAGRIDELAIFNRALSLKEIQTLYKGPKQKASQP